MTGLRSCHLLGLSVSALLAYSSYEWNHKPIHRHISCFAIAILDLYHIQNLSRSFYLVWTPLKVLLVGVDHFGLAHSGDT